jgi:YEATS domain-containing protein 4
MVKQIRFTSPSYTGPFLFGRVTKQCWNNGIGKRAEDQNSHRWVVYVRGVNGEDQSYFIKEVAFHLHPSFKNPIRSKRANKKYKILAVAHYPFEVHESGWGEFEIMIKIIFKEDIKPLEIFHHLKV